jgi:hypothetical protein
MQTIKRRRLSADAWAATVKMFQASGLSAETFCERERVSLTSLRRWLRSPPQQRSASQMPAAVAGLSTPAVERAEFVDLGTLSSQQRRIEVRLEFGGGLVLQLSRS